MKKFLSILIAIIIATMAVVIPAVAESADEHFILREEHTWSQIRGDLNNDNQITATDALIALQLSVGIKFDTAVHMMSVLNEEPTSIVALKILRAAVGYHDENYGEPITFPISIDQNHLVVHDHCVCCKRYVEYGYAIAFSSMSSNSNVVCNDCYAHIHTLTY